MDESALRLLLDDVRDGTLAPDDAVAALRRLPFVDLGFARVDHHRSLRQGAAETVYAPGKTPGQCAAIVGELLDGGATPVVLSRVDDEQAAAALGAHPDGERCASTIVWRPRPAADPDRRVTVITAGTADHTVATEAAVVLSAHGVEVDRVDDVGVAGLHRLLAEVDRIAAARLVVVVAGMEGALASVVGGLASCPVIAVPTSVGYGSSLDGVTALLSMHASCASGVTVVGIDNGFGAAMAAVRILGSTSPAAGPDSNRAAR